MRSLRRSSTTRSSLPCSRTPRRRTRRTRSARRTTLDSSSTSPLACSQKSTSSTPSSPSCELGTTTTWTRDRSPRRVSGGSLALRTSRTLKLTAASLLLVFQPGRVSSTRTLHEATLPSSRRCSTCMSLAFAYHHGPLPIATDTEFSSFAFPCFQREVVDRRAGQQPARDSQPTHRRQGPLGRQQAYRREEHRHPLARWRCPCWRTSGRAQHSGHPRPGSAVPQQ